MDAQLTHFKENFEQNVKLRDPAWPTGLERDLCAGRSTIDQ
jgi:hypothetical protein